VYISDPTVHGHSQKILYYFDNLEFDIFDAGRPQFHFIVSVTIAVRIRTLSGH